MGKMFCSTPSIKSEGQFFTSRVAFIYTKLDHAEILEILKLGTIIAMAGTEKMGSPDICRLDVSWCLRNGLVFDT